MRVKVKKKIYILFKYTFKCTSFWDDGLLHLFYIAGGRKITECS